MDRALSKLCCLPLFGTQVRDLLDRLNLVTVEQFLAFDVLDSDEFFEQLVIVVPPILVSAPDDEVEKILTQVLELRSVLGALWHLIRAGAHHFVRDNAVAHGFGQADWSRNFDLGRPQKRALAGRNLVESGLVRSPKKPTALPTHTDPSLKLLATVESNAKLKWLSRLERIAEEAGDLAKINNSAEEIMGILTSEEKLKMRRLVLSQGSFRTMNVHIRHWERFRDWAVDGRFKFYPPSHELLLKYLMSLDLRGCGPTVVTSVRSAVLWMGNRLQMPVPDAHAPDIKALETKIIEERAKEVREAIPYPIELIVMLEDYVVSSSSPLAYSIFAGFLLCTIYASLRFNDAMHVKTSSLDFQDTGLYGLAWQTKVDRRRRGTRFVVARTGFSQSTWLEVWWELFQTINGDRDYWMPEVANQEAFTADPMTYSRGLQHLHFVCAKALELAQVSNKFMKAQIMQVAKTIPLLRWHSSRVTLLNAAVHAGKNAEAISLQANWKAPGPMVLKYTRNRREVPLNMVNQLVQELRQSWQPAGEPIEFDDEELVPVDPVPMFYQKFPKVTRSSFKIEMLKFHVSHSSDCSKTQCGIPVTECEPVGSSLPGSADGTMLCGKCCQARPELVQVAV